MINIYIADLTGLENEYDEKLNMLHKSRADKLASYRMPADKIRGLGAGLLLEKGLEDYFSNLCANTEESEQDKSNRCSNADILPKDEEGRYIIEYGYGPQGKPYLKDFPEVHFSLSHSGNMVVLAVSDEEVGIDVQEHRGYNEKIAERFYHEEERKMLDAVSDSEKKAILFYRIWSGKEAYIKYTGKGMGQELKSFYRDLQSGMIYDNGEITAKCTDVFIEQSNYQCCVVSGNTTKIIDKILKIML